jgi:hypothetical protein
VLAARLAEFAAAFEALAIAFEAEFAAFASWLAADWAALAAALAAFAAEFIALATVRLAFATVLLLVASPPQAIPMAPITRTADRAITFFIRIDSPVSQRLDLITFLSIVRADTAGVFQIFLTLGTQDNIVIV